MKLPDWIEEIRERADSEKDLIGGCHQNEDVKKLVTHIESLQKKLEASIQIEYDCGIIKVEGQSIADHSELPKENERLVRKLEVAEKALEKIESNSDCRFGSFEGCDAECRIFAREALQQIRKEKE